MIRLDICVCCGKQLNEGEHALRSSMGTVGNVQEFNSLLYNTHDLGLYHVKCFIDSTGREIVDSYNKAMRDDETRQHQD